MCTMKLYILKIQLCSSRSKIYSLYHDRKFWPKNFRVIVGQVRLFETIFGIFIALKHFFELVALLG
eukprot:UN01957